MTMEATALPERNEVLLQSTLEEEVLAKELAEEEEELAQGAFVRALVRRARAVTTTTKYHHNVIVTLSVTTSLSYTNTVEVADTFTIESDVECLPATILSDPGFCEVVP